MLQGSLECGEFMHLFQFMASKDSSMDPSFMENLQNSLQEVRLCPADKSNKQKHPLRDSAK
jgi:hypothetical protein